MAKQTLNQRIKANMTGRNKSSSNTVKLLLEACERNRDHYDWTGLTWLVGLSEGSERARLKALVETVTGGKVKGDKKQPSGFRWVNGESENVGNKIGLLSEYCAQNVTVGSKLFVDGMTVDGEKVPALLPKVVKPLDYDARAKALIKAGFADGMSADEMRARFELVIAAQEELEAA